MSCDHPAVEDVAFVVREEASTMVLDAPIMVVEVCKRHWRFFISSRMSPVAEKKMIVSVVPASVKVRV